MNSQDDVVAHSGNSNGGNRQRGFLTICNINPSLEFNLHFEKIPDLLEEYSEKCWNNYPNSKIQFKIYFSASMYLHF